MAEQTARPVDVEEMATVAHHVLADAEASHMAMAVAEAIAKHLATPVVEIAPGTAGTATITWVVPPRKGVRVMRVADAYSWVDDRGNRYTDESVTDFVPDLRFGSHACPRCGEDVINRKADPERTDLCPPCTAALFQEDADLLRARITREVDANLQTARERDEARAEVERLRAIAPELHKIWPGPSTDRAEVMDVVDVLTQQARDAASVPAQEPQGASGGTGTSGGLGDRLRAEAEAGRVGQHARLSAIADQVDRLERERDHLRGRVVELIEGKGALPFEHDHQWVTTTTYADSARGVTVQECTVPGCPAVLETRP